MTVLLDSSAWLEYFFGSSKGKVIKTVIEERTEPVVVSKINVSEVYSKILREQGREQAERFTAFILMRATLDDLPIDILKLAAEEKQKYHLGMADAIIIATAIQYDAKVYTTDSDFKKVEKAAEIVLI